MVSPGIRVSATVILTLKGLVSPLGPASHTCKTLSKNVIKAEKGLQVLTLRRGQNDRLLPGVDVFPGGQVERSDFNSEWLELYAANGFSEDSFHKLSSPSYASMESPEMKGGLPPWLGLRIGAIRETFEECGILLCCCPGGSSIRSPWTSYTIMQDVEIWQKRVMADPHQMLALCQSKGCVPDVWGLHLWSNWVTPAHIPMRHNAVFFLAVLHSEPPHSLDFKEMDNLMWRTPDAILDGTASGEISMAVPQVYEISRLARFSTAESLSEFAAKRAVHGCPTWMSVWHKARDGVIFLLPGDSEYPLCLDSEKKKIKQLDCTVSEAAEKVVRQNGTLHRAVKFEDDQRMQLFVHNYTPPSEHVLPVSKQTVIVLKSLL